jgi:hypothetical protein
MQGDYARRSDKNMILNSSEMNYRLTAGPIKTAEVECGLGPYKRRRINDNAVSMDERNICGS